MRFIAICNIQRLAEPHVYVFLFRWCPYISYRSIYYINWLVSQFDEGLWQQ